ncbi:DUF2500 domain-containing protein [Brevibacillus fortis]|uniref:DUF2500 domain-containing protein n=1 Tax=Brevibacillus fortis TaxID=2126352 RepID=A0A2P7UJS5_9BACL|nr:DUF2500 domain-containing protein [Brevibacillus fortis]MED1780538.1 DUF2500 domain-containing protein [Brevibacillus fortis]PSJ87262.1 DUF2500 domain-containing protein [Brevibacillus fortis]
MFANDFGPPFSSGFGPPWWFLVIAGIIVLFILGAIINGIRIWMSNNASPILTQPAKIISKRTSTSGGGNDTSVSTYYYLTFELSNGERLEFHVKGSEYGLLVEGDTGILTYQGTRYKEFSRRPL